MKLVTHDTGLSDLKGKPLPLWQFNDERIATKDDGIAFFVSQLTYLESTIYKALYRDIVFEDFIPTVYTDPDEVQDITYISYDTVTSAKLGSANMEDMPEPKITANKSVIPVHYGTNAYSYSLEELRISQRQRMPLDTIQAEAAFRGYQELAQRMGFFGDAARNITGLYNNATLEAGKKIGVVDWNTASNDDIVQDMNNLIKKVWTDSSQVHLPDTLILDPDRYTKITSTRMDSGTDTTIATFFERENLYTQRTKRPLRIDQNIEIQSASTGAEAANGRMMAYELDPIRLTMRIPFAWISDILPLQPTRISPPHLLLKRVLWQT